MNSKASIFKKKIKEYFSLNIRRVSLLSMIFAINLVLLFISKYILGLVPIFSFLVIEITFISYLICFKIVNSFYAIILIFLSTWFRFFLGSDWVGLLAMNLTDLFALLNFVLIFHLFKFIFKKIKSDLKSDLISISISIVFSILGVSLFGGFINWLFILSLYREFIGVNINWSWWYFSIIIIFSVIKYGINFILYLIIYRFLFMYNTKI